MSKKENQNAILPVDTELQGGKYTITGFISSGGFGNTYIAHNNMLDIDVAMKEFFIKGINSRTSDTRSVVVSNETNAAQFNEQREKFKREAQRISKLDNHHIVRVMDLFEENGTAYYVMELIHGKSLNDMVLRAGRPLSESVVRVYLPQILDALDEVHSKNIYHLDLKPANVLVDRNGHIKVIDFGASKQLSSVSHQFTTTAVTYTPGYAPREQLEHNSNKFGPWTDLYSLGATLYFCLTACDPPSQTDIIDLRQKAFKFPVTVSNDMRQLILWLMNDRRTKRPQSVAAVYQALRTFAPLDMPSTSPSQPPVPNSVPPYAIYGGGEPQVQALQQAPDSGPAPSPQPNSSPVPNSQPVSKPVSQPVNQQAIPVVDSREVYYEPYNDEEDEESKSRKRNIIVAAISAVVAALVILAIAFFTGGPKNVNNVSFTLANGEPYVYSGTVDDHGVPNGNGVAKFANSTSYEGQFNHGVMQGDSVTYKTLEWTFVGAMYDNKFLNGTLTYADGSYFKGTFDGFKPADGTYYNADGTQKKKR